MNMQAFIKADEQEYLFKFGEQSILLFPKVSQY